MSAITLEAAAALSWLRKATPDLNQVKAALEVIQASGQRAAEIIHSLRAMFKKDSTDKAPIDINSLILAVLAIARIDLNKSQIQVQTDLDDQLPVVEGDKVQLQQVILNLVMNAIEAMQPVQRRVLRVHSQRSKPNRVAVSIEDSGTGIDPSNIDRVFKPLFSTKLQGMGVGRSIC